MFYIYTYTDGSAIGNPGPGGWGAVIVQGRERRELSGANPWTTISEMEVLAAVEALRSIPSGKRVLLRSDSSILLMACVILLGDGRPGAARTVVAHQFNIASFGLN
jgi:ribonuclease HI